MPIAIRIIPPKTDDLPAKRVPNLFPIITPNRQIIKVTAQMTSEDMSASITSYSTIVKPTDNASIDVAIP